MSNYRSSNPFEDDDYTAGFGERKPIGGGSTDLGDKYGSGWGDDEPEDYDQSIQAQKQRSMNRQLASTQRAMAKIYESESIGIATAEELVHQGEQLDNVERKTTQINQELKTTQTHLNSIKSVFGGIKNWWSGKNKGGEQQPSDPVPARESRLRDTLEATEETKGPHPALLRADAGPGIYHDSGASATSSSQYDGGASAGGYGRQSKVSSYEAYDAALDSNLDVMAGGMSRLKMLAQGLGSEIEAQNEQIDRIGLESDKAGSVIQNQNAQMRNILGVKKK